MADPYDEIDARTEAARMEKAAAPPAPTPPAATAPQGDHSVRNAIEIGGAGALGAGAVALGARYPELGRALARLRGFVHDRPILGAGSVGAVSGAAAATPHAIETGNPEDIALGAAAGAPAGIALRAGADPLVRRIAQLGSNSAERAVAPTILADNADAKAASARLKGLAQHLRSTARGANPNQETVADVLGPQSQALARDSLATPSPEAKQFADQLAARQQGATGRVEGAVNQALAPSPYDAAEKQLLASLKQNSTPLYQKAYAAFPSVNSPVFNQDVMNTKEGQAAAKWAAEQWKTAHPGTPIGPVSAGGMTTAPALEYHQLVKEYLDGEVSSTAKRVKGGTANRKELNTIAGLRDRYVDDLDQLTGGDQSPYVAARQQYSSDAKVLDALHEGRDDFDKMTPVVLRARMMHMGTGLSAEKDAFLSGVSENLMRKLGSTRVPPGGVPTTNPVMRIADDPDTQQKLLALFDDPKQAQAFMATLQRESEMFQRSKGMLGAAAQAPASAVQPQSSALGQVVKAGAHSINPKLAVLRAAIDSTKKRLPYPGIARLMSQTGVPAAGQVEDLNAAVQRLSRGLSGGQTAGLGAATLGAGAAGATAAALGDKQ